MSEGLVPQPSGQVNEPAPSPSPTPEGRPGCGAGSGSGTGEARQVDDGPVEGVDSGPGEGQRIRRDQNSRLELTPEQDARYWEKIKDSEIKLADGTTSTPAREGFTNASDFLNTRDPRFQSHAGGFNDPAVAVLGANALENSDRLTRITAQNDTFRRQTTGHSSGVKLDFGIAQGGWSGANAAADDIARAWARDYGLIRGVDYQFFLAPHNTGAHVDVEIFRTGINKTNRIVLGN